MKDILSINTALLQELHEKAKENVRLRMNHDLRTSTADTSQRMLNVLEPGTVVPIHRHEETSETVVCLEGRFDEIFFEEVTSAEQLGDSRCTDVACKREFKEISRVVVCPREGQFGVQIPKGAWHTIEVYEPSTIFEAKDGAYKG